MLNEYSLGEDEGEGTYLRNVKRGRRGRDEGGRALPEESSGSSGNSRGGGEGGISSTETIAKGGIRRKRGGE